MFKRVDKRRRKKEEEEKLGLDEEVKEILGIQDTDSEESESESDPDEDEEEGSAVDEEMDGENEDEDEGEEDSSITVSEALKDPVYIVSIDPDVKACIVCPGKLLKSIKMVQLHRTSNAHIRRFKQFSDASADANSNDIAWEILKRNSETKSKLSLTTSSGASKRAEKKKASQARRKARRVEAKEKARVKKLKATSESTPAQPSDTPASTKPPKKKRKVDQVPPAKISITPASAAAAKVSNKKESVTGSAAEDNDDSRGPSHIQSSVKIQDIVKSTSNRAKTARSRALSMSKNTSRLTKSAVA